MQPRPEPSARQPTAVAAMRWGGGAAFLASLGYFLYAYLMRFGVPAPGDRLAAPVLADLALFTGFALHHSLFARTPLKDWIGRTVSPRLERSIYTWVASALFTAVCWWWIPVPGDLYRIEGAWQWLGWIAQAAGFVVTVHAARRLGVLRLAGVHADSTDSPPPLATSGAFAVVRHPLYLAWALFTFGTTHMTATRLVFASVSTAYLALAIHWEERGLVRTYGGAYEAYRRRTRWRMLPGIY